MDLTDQNAPEEFADSIVCYEHGARKRLGTFWAEQPALLVFLRHFACPGCWEQVATLAPRIAALRKSGVRVVLVGVAEPSRILPFRDRVRLEDANIDLVVDPSLACHRAAGLVRSSWATYGPRGSLGAIRLYTQGRYVARHDDDGDVTQQGGALLVDPTNRVLFHHVAAHPTDYMDLTEVLRRAEGSGDSWHTLRL